MNVSRCRVRMVPRVRTQMAHMFARVRRAGRDQTARGMSTSVSSYSARMAGRVLIRRDRLPVSVILDGQERHVKLVRNK